MGNCLGTQLDNESHDPRSNFVNPTSSVLFNSGTSRVHSNGGVMSVSSSSDDHNQMCSSASVVAVLNGEILTTSNFKEYTLSELKSATGNFKRDAIVRVGGSSTVYKGWVDKRTLAPSKPGSGMMVAIKYVEKESVQGYQEWQSEVNFLGRLSHPNLVRLLGYCWDNTVRGKVWLLVYEFVPKESLENHLFRRVSDTEPLSWDIRLRIAIGAARGLAFLHSSERQIIYRAFKASNVLLDDNYNAKITDFGLAKLGPAGDNTHVSTRIIDTDGYAAPEYLSTGHLYVKSDVYGFGVVLLEILTGLRAMDSQRPSGQHYLVEWMKPQLSNKSKFKSLMDASIKGQYSTKAAHLAAQLTLKCLETEQTNRPAMREIVEVLEQIQAIKEKDEQSKLKKWTFFQPFNPCTILPKHRKK